MNLSSRIRYCLITDRTQTRLPLKKAIEAALRGGFRAVQLREKDLPARELLRLAIELREITARYDALLIINDRVDIAIAAGADGVHLGWQSIPAETARGLFGNEKLIGVSTHSLEEARRAEKDGADYITLGPVFDTPSKKGLVPTLGLTRFGDMAQQIIIPVIGLGGIDSENAAQVFEAGADGIAVIRAVLASSDPAAAASEIIARSAD